MGRHGVSALGRLYDLTATRLVRYAFTLTRNQADAEDALQAAMVQIALKPGSLARAEYPWPYFLKVVRNEALTIVRVRRTRQLPPEFIPFDERSMATSPFDDPEVGWRIREAVDQLPPLQSEIVVLKIWEQMTFAEMAAVLGESPNTVASRYRYALQKLSRDLRVCYEEVFYDR